MEDMMFSCFETTFKPSIIKSMFSCKLKMLVRLYLEKAKQKL